MLLQATSKMLFDLSVVWNPWEKGLNMADLGEEYVHMLCVEAGHVSSRVNLHSGDDYVVSQTLTVVS
jgi:D-hexose-6-phosphate mutarotase